ncbi:MAG: tetratricopeptide repeat protein [Chitinophagales bacterium]
MDKIINYNSDEYIKLFERYYEDEMPLPEAKKFEKRLEEKEDFRKEFELYITLIQILKKHFAMFILVGFIGLNIVGFYQNHLLNSLTNEYAYASPKSMKPDNSINTITVFEEGIDLREQQKYDEALQVFRQINKENNVYYFGHAQIEIALIKIKQGKLEEAKTILHRFIDTSENEKQKTRAKNIINELSTVWFWLPLKLAL